MPSFIKSFVDSGPFVPVYLFLLAAVAFRSTVIYYLGRYGTTIVATGGDHSRGIRRKAWQMVQARQTKKYAEAVRRGGWLVVSGAYLTVGVQTLVVIGCAVIGLSWLQFALAALLGWMAWALIYSTIGFAVWRAAAKAAAGSPMGIAIIVTTLAILAMCYVAYRRRRRSRASELACASAHEDEPAEENRNEYAVAAQ